MKRAVEPELDDNLGSLRLPVATEALPVPLNSTLEACSSRALLFWGTGASISHGVRLVERLYLGRPIWISGASWGL